MSQRVRTGILGALRDVRFTPKSRHSSPQLQCPLCAKSGHAGYFQLWVDLLLNDDRQ
jgi:hypothetical protein